MLCDHPPGPRRLREVGRIAIWDRERIVVVIAMSVWLTDIAFIIDGKHLMDHGRTTLTRWYNRHRTGEFPISTVLDLLGSPDNRSSALHGRLWQAPASHSTSRALNLLLLPYSSPTLCYFSSCSSVCSAFARMEAAPLVWDFFSGSRCGDGISRCL